MSTLKSFWKQPYEERQYHLKGWLLATLKYNNHPDFSAAFALEDALFTPGSYISEVAGWNGGRKILEISSEFNLSNLVPHTTAIKVATDMLRKKFFKDRRFMRGEMK